LTSEAFDLESNYPPGMTEKLEAFTELSRKISRDAGENERFEELRDFLDDNLAEAPETAENRALQKRLREMMADWQQMSDGSEAEA